MERSLIGLAVNGEGLNQLTEGSCSTGVHGLGKRSGTTPEVVSSRGVRAIGSALLFGALVFAVSFPFWVAAVAAVVVRAGGGGTRIFYAAGVLAAVTGALFGLSFWRHRRVGDRPYWERIFQRR